MKVLIAYYSKSGHTAAIADTLRRELEQLGTSVESHRAVRKQEAGFFGSATESRRQKSPELVNEHKDLSGYDLVLVGFPIWASYAASPANTMVKGFSGVSGMRFGVFASCGFPTGYVGGITQVTESLTALGGRVVATQGFSMRHAKNMENDVKQFVTALLG